MGEKAEQILLAHGSGGRLSHDLVGSSILKALPDPVLEKLTDSAELELDSRRIAFTTDSYTVRPLFFPGGDIGRLAVCGTVNDLAAMGAKPRFLSLALIIEEGLERAVLDRVVGSIAAAAREAGVRIVTGDTKVVEKGKGDGLFINTAGIGELGDGPGFSPERIAAGDKVLVNGTIGDHGAAVISERQALGIGGLASDCAPLWGLVKSVLDAGCKVKFMRDATRGGLATVLNEAAAGRSFGFTVSESAVPMREPVRAFCELLGFDPLYMANEGKMVLVAAPEDAERALAALRAHPLGRDAAVIGEAVPAPAGKVFLATAVRGRRILDMLVGDQFPRIC
ncbi:MAG: hydrogenase expression/formation protein HypE [Elusimicrobia bacterium GWA2_69_24]|nr:MAG: hydrogenase expression/formation protein HypE [Elusimicrobia bacterium GWA2_69_24]HBL18691.1 hydrogenase expression/formation protein HypE [Elusimicrobiota bacterium]